MFGFLLISPFFFLFFLYQTCSFHRASFASLQVMALVWTQVTFWLIITYLLYFKKPDGEEK